MSDLPVAIIGAGPVGLAAAAHLSERGQSFVIFESGAQIGDSVSQWGHVPMFSPWKYNIDSACAQILEKYVWSKPDPEQLPKGKELLDDYLRPLAETNEIKPFLRLNARVASITRKRISKLRNHSRDNAPFILRYLQGGTEHLQEARAVIDASGTWKNPNPAGADGLPAIGEPSLGDHIHYGIPDVLGKMENKYLGKDVTVIGGGHSAINSLLELADLKKKSNKMNLHWVLTKANVEDAYGGLGNDQLPGRGRVGQKVKELVNEEVINVHAPFFVERIEKASDKIAIVGQSTSSHTIRTDEVIVATGLRPNLELLREVRVSLDEGSESPTRLAPLIDPNVHSCGSVKPHGEAELRHPEKDFYIVGMKSYGRAPTFLLATGYEQVRSVVAGLVGDWEAAKQVRLELPETGVCGVPSAVDPNEIASCCEPEADTLVAQSSCC